MHPEVYVLILNCNGREHLAYCLPSVLATDYPRCHVLLIDNGSQDDSLAFARTHYPQVEIIANARNLGWAAGNNVGLRRALDRGAAAYVVLLNNDMRVDPRWLTHAVAAAEADPLIGVVGFDTVGEYHLDADPDLIEFERRRAAWRGPEVAETEHVAGCAMFLRAELLRDVGLLDERFFAYGEEDDLQKRAGRAGYRSVRVNVPLWHYNGGSFGKRALRAAVLAQRNHVRGMIKSDPPRAALRRLRDMVVFICWPGVEYDRSHAHLRRLRPSIYPVNVGILLYAVLWNLVMLPATLLARRRDERRVRQARRRLAARQPPGREDSR
jgi:GT2 family glycosyltransferase